MPAKTPALILVQSMDSGEFSDLTFVSNEEEFKVHKVIVCQQSPVIKAAVRGPFEESHTNVIRMDKFQPSTVKRMIQFMYTGDYDNPIDKYGDGQDAPLGNDSEREEKTGEAIKTPQFGSVEESDADSVSSERPISLGSYRPAIKTALFEHIQVNSIGDYYGLDELVSLANTKIETLLGIDSRSEPWVVANLPAATEAAIKSTGDKGLLDIFATSVEKNLLKIQDWDEFESLEILSEFSAKVLKNCAATIESLMTKLEVSKLQHELEEASLTEEIVVKDREIEEKDARIMKMMLAMAKLRETDYCRNTCCDADFQPYIDPIECILRCKKCRCKHN